MVAQYTLGKKVAFPLGIFMGLSVLNIAIAVIICEFTLIIAVDVLFSFAFDRIKWAQWLKERLERVQERLQKRSWTAPLVKLGWLGPLTITAMPFAGGVWTGMAFARILTLSHRTTLWVVSIGALLGCAIFALAALGILSLVNLPVYEVTA